MPYNSSQQLYAYQQNICFCVSLYQYYTDSCSGKRMFGEWKIVDSCSLTSYPGGVTVSPSEDGPYTISEYIQLYNSWSSDAFIAQKTLPLYNIDITPVNHLGHCTPAMNPLCIMQYTRLNFYSYCAL